MALPKRIKVGGSYYKGYTLSVGASTGAYPLIIAQTSGLAVNSLSVTPGAAGVGDTWKLRHYNDNSGTGKVTALLAEDIPNMGKNATVMLDFPAAEKVDTGECLRLDYTNVAGTGMSVFVIVEAVGIHKVE